MISITDLYSAFDDTSFEEPILFLVLTKGFIIFGIFYMYVFILNYSRNSIQWLIFIAIIMKLHLGQLQCTSQDDIFDNVSREDNYWHLHSHHSEPKNNTTE